MAPVQYSEARDLRWIMILCGLQSLLATAEDDICTAEVSSIWDGPKDHGFGCGDASYTDCHRGHFDRVYPALCPPAV